MAEITKFRAEEVVYHIRHDLRELSVGNDYGNTAVTPSLSCNNYSLLKDRCQTAAEANKYRKEIEKECFKYNRKNLIHAVEVVVQCPFDCPPEQHQQFFQETYNYICSTLPMGDRCVFTAQVHVDEQHFTPSGEMISKEHLHLMYVPAVPDLKHAGFSYRLCADQLTKKAELRKFHPGLQAHLDQHGIQATVYHGKKSSGKNIALSVAQMKELTEKTGIKIEHSLTVDELATILSQNIELRKTNNELMQKIRSLQFEIETAKTQEVGWGNNTGWGNLEKTHVEEHTW